MGEARTTIHPQPTPFVELDEVMRVVTERAGAILGDSFVGAYLRGSFAVGDADLHSDCDFLIPVLRPITAVQEAALRVMHGDLPTRPGHWNRHLEGSYPLVDELRTLQALGCEWLYIDHGWRQMQWSAHCNSEVVRWSLRERGVTLLGPDPRTLVDAVPPAALRARMLQSLPTLMTDLHTWLNFDIGWAQRYAVTTHCRMLNTLATGEVTSKRAALVWAGENLDPRWRGLLEEVLSDRTRGYDPSDPPRPGSVEQMQTFAAYALDWARGSAAREG